MKEEESINNKQVYIDNVLKPFQFIAWNNDVNIGNGYFSFFSPTNNINKLEENTIQLLKNQELINDLIKEALLESTAVLPGNDKTFFVMPLSPEDTFPIQEMEGVTGAAFSENAVLVKIDPSFVEEALKYLVAHEYHHTVRMEEAGVMGGTLLDSFITEGQAEVFARSVYPDKTPPWEQEPLTEETKNIILEELTKNIDSTDRDIYIDFVSGNPSKKVPTCGELQIGI
ncbi:hypothetical protein Q73_06000 [Bacillus coahuilensis m2-6]|uniref:DUF2268 domain-containing protein n=1 Tax=Bacillus coahuilensis TaxID=408580 RepID=UPI000750672E|nr:DUF2268 domain-containing putative Zn-dependent protease [Bacillus coahuilensis]KUP08463.1 hypothetical protein Q73_06000 [Bacillus coahuilensis m2-6]